MNPRLLLPEKLRWHMAVKWVERAEQNEDMADRLIGKELSHQYAMYAMWCYLHAMCWWPVEFPLNFPAPEDLGSHPADEQLYADEMSELRLASREGDDEEDDSVITCVLCGTLIPVRLMGGTGGIYCTACVKL